VSILDIIYEDNHALGVVKPAGMLVQGDDTGDPSALDLAKAYIKEAYDKPGAVFLGLVHRIDRPVSGVVLFARTSKAASRLARSFHDRKAKKAYLAVVSESPPRDTDTLRALIGRDGVRARFALEPGPGVKEGVLEYRVLERAGGLTLVEVVPETGRHHQIRLQLSGEGCPVVGDVRYGAGEGLRDRSIALHSARLAVPHPTRDETITLSAPPAARGPWKRFASTIRDYFSIDE
jgi:23S rRNA pseudouridine1911/1915/1917 synthase